MINLNSYLMQIGKSFSHNDIFENVNSHCLLTYLRTLETFIMLVYQHNLSATYLKRESFVVHTTPYPFCM